MLRLSLLTNFGHHIIRIGVEHIFAKFCEDFRLPDTKWSCNRFNVEELNRIPSRWEVHWSNSFTVGWGYLEIARRRKCRIREMKPACITVQSASSIDVTLRYLFTEKSQKNYQIYTSIIAILLLVLHDWQMWSIAI